jgi:hypothetical protein
MKLSHDLQAIRIGRDTEVKIALSVRPLLLDNKLREMRKEALRRGSAFLEKWAGQNDADLNYAKMVIALERYAWIRDRADFVDHRISELEQKLSSEERTQLEPEAILELEQELGELSNERRDIGREIKESYIELGKFQSDAELLEHWRSCDCSELRSWAENSGSDSATFIQLRKLLKIHVDWESRFGRSEEFRAALISSSQVIAGTCLGIMGIPGRNEIEYDLCIVDEASIASPTQVMVPMSRARRTVLVGDSNQLSPFDDPELKESGLLEQFELVPEDMKETLFNHLSEGLPAGLRKTLTTQHRMLKPIGDLISECFYGGQLKSKGRAAKNLLASVLPKPVVWLSTAKLQNRASERIGTTCANDCEVSQIVSLLDRFNTELSKQKNEKPISIAVLTGYSEQRIRLRAAIDRKRAKWGAIGDIYVNVVDAFQGRDADVAIFSVTRSDKGGLGFLKEMERINVALSRGKEYLVIVGDHFFCQKIDAHSNPLKNVLSYITSHPADCQLVEVAK